MIKKKTYVLNFRVTKDERDLISDQAKSRKITLSKFIKNACLEFKKKHLKIDKKTHLLNLAIDNYNERNNLRNLSNNLNQIAKHLNKNKYLENKIILDNIEQLQTEIKKLNKINTDILKKFI